MTNQECALEGHISWGNTEHEICGRCGEKFDGRDDRMVDTESNDHFPSEYGSYIMQCNNDDNSDAWIEPQDPKVLTYKELGGTCDCGAPLMWDELDIWCVNGECGIMLKANDIIKQLKSTAEKNYIYGGDTYVECYDRALWIMYIQENGRTSIQELEKELGVPERAGKSLKGLYFVEVQAEDGTHKLGSQLTLQLAMNKAKEFSEYAFNQFTENNRSAVTLYGSILSVVEHE
jgi:hypothetical protein